MYGGTLKATSESTAPGITVTLTASGLSEYTSYSIKVRATETSTAQKLWDEKNYGSIRTFCPGARYGSCTNTKIKCSGTWRYTGSYVAGRHLTDCPETQVAQIACSECGKSGLASFTCPKCHIVSGGYASPGESCWLSYNKCSRCGGINTTYHTIQCPHGKLNQHD